ncbi:AT-rich interactive domain-containing protein 6-like [Corylus avellana]|uniref:AT-rich interactive domain-containing protein 6-like n=1 Tax=Corylus avellana TaxID=13451 RepID=UPI00286D1321|nr:AT-rich interactive domain-containing protein 6-like [Corylus avellana]
MDDNKEKGKNMGEDKDNNLTTHTRIQVDEEKEEEPNPTLVQNVDLKKEKCIDEFPVENQGPVDSATSTLETTNDGNITANELTHGNAGTDIKEIIPSNPLEADSPSKRSLEIAPEVGKKDDDIEETDGSDLNPANQLPPEVPRERSMETEAKYDEKRHELNVGMSNMELSPNREIKEQVSKLKLDLGHEVGMKSSEQSFLLVPDGDHGVEGYESGTEDEQAAFMMEVENFCKEKSLEFKPPKFYQKELNLLKLWRAVIKLGGYEQVTSCKLWRQVGQSFNPPKTCTTVSWTFRIFYEKALLEYEKHKMGAGELTEPTRVNNQVSGSQAIGSGRTLRDAAARAMQGWHSRRLFGHGEIGDLIVKGKNSSSMPKVDKQLKNIGLLKRKQRSTVERNVQVAHIKVTKPQLETMVVDVGPPADWVKINVQRFDDCFEVYALVPGLLREEVHVQSDPAGCLVISGQPAELDNPWGVTPFKKLVSLPSRIDPHQTSAVVTLHGQLFVRVPIEQSDS